MDENVGLLPAPQLIKFDSLGQRQLLRPVDDTGLSPHIALPRFGPGFASAACILFAAEGTSNFRSGSANIDIGDTAVAALMAEKYFRFMQIKALPMGKDIATFRKLLLLMK